MTSLYIQLLGGFSLTFEASLVSNFHQPRRQALLAYLLLHRGTPQLRSSIAFLFWPDSTDQQARTNLRRLLYSVRRALPQANQYLALTTETIQWRNESPFQLDVAQFEARLEQAAEAHDPVHQQDALQAAIRAYTGDLLPGFHDEWILAERERLRSRYTLTLRQLATLHEGRREYVAAIDVARRLLEVDTMQETSYRLLMKLQLLNNDRAAALAVYHRCTTMLADELGVDPSPLTEELYMRVLRLEAEEHDTRPASPPVVSLPLVGREKEWGLLSKAWRAVQRDRASLFLIQGEAGIGKTRLAQELLQTARRQGTAVRQTRAYAARGAGPYSPLVDLLQSGGPQSMLSNLDREWLAELVRLYPELRSGRDDIPAPTPMAEAWQRQRFHEALARAILAAGQPLLILFDDMQWCDVETLAWLRFLFAYQPRGKLLILGTVRDDEIDLEHPLNRLRYDLEQEGRCHVVNLKPLEYDDAASLITEVVGSALSQAQCTQLFARSEGNPLFVVEWLRAGNAVERQTMQEEETLEQEGDATATPLVEGPPPPRVQAVIQWRLAQLPPPARALATTAATIGRRFNHEILASVSELNERDLIHYLDELWRRRIIREDADGTYDFSHDLLREVAYGETSPMRKRYLHRRIAEALCGACVADCGPVASRVAYHFEQAGDFGQARTYFGEAGQHAASQYANEDAARYFGRAIELTNQEDGSGHNLAPLYTRRGRALELDGRFLAAMENYREMESVARGLDDASMLLTSKTAQATLLATPTAIHDPLQGERLVEQALSLARDLNDQAAEAKLLWNRLLIYGFTHRFAEAIDSGERALALAQKLNLQEETAYILNDLAYRCYRQVGRLNKANETLREACRLWRTLGNLPMLADSLSALSVISVDVGEYEPALAYSREAKEISEKTDNLWGQAYSQFDVGWIYWEYGRPDEAITTMEACIGLADRVGFLGAQTNTRVDLSLILADLGADGESMDTMHQALTLAETHFPAIQAYVLVRLAELHIAQGRLKKAESLLEQVKAAPHWLERASESFSFAEAKLALKQDHRERAIAVAERLLVEYRQSERKKHLSEILHLNGQVLQAAGRNDAAWRHLCEARDVAEALGSRRMLWPILLSLSRLAGDPTESQRLRQEARDIVAYIADQTNRPHLRASFLKRPEVYELLGG